MTQSTSGTQGLTYSVDVVICIDATGSMGGIIEEVKQRAVVFPDDVTRALSEHGKSVTRMRVRIIAFRDVRFDAEPFQVSDFFTIPDQVADYQAFVKGIAAMGGGDDPESGLEAIAIAMHSDWATDMDKLRHVIFVLTDASAHKLEEGAGHVPAAYATIMPKDLNELTDWWQGTSQTAGLKLRPSAKRMILFAPEAYPWSNMSIDWEECAHTMSKAGQGGDIHYAQVLELLAKSV